MLPAPPNIESGEWVEPPARNRATTDGMVPSVAHRRDSVLSLLLGESLEEQLVDQALS